MTCDLYTTYFASPTIGARCYVEAKVERLGRFIAFTSAIMTNEAGEVLAKASQTARLVDAPKA